MIRAAIIGLGWWGQTILRTLTNSAIVAPVLGIDPKQQARDVASALGIETAPQFEDALADASIDAVILCTPQQYHAEQIVPVSVSWATVVSLAGPAKSSTE